MRKGFVIMAAIAMITVSAAAVTVANISDDQANSQQIKGLTYDVKAQSRISTFDSSGDADVQLLHYSKNLPNNYFFFGHAI